MKQTLYNISASYSKHFSGHHLDTPCLWGLQVKSKWTMRALWDYTIFQGAVEFFLKKKQNLLLMCCFAKLGMGWAGQRQLTKEKGNKPWTAWCPFPGFPSPLNGSFWSFPPPIGPPAFPSSLPNRILQAAASGLHPKTPLPLPAPSLSHPLFASARTRLGLGGSFLFSVTMMVLWPSHTLRSHINLPGNTSVPRNTVSH